MTESLETLWKARRWDYLLMLIDGLPDNSHLRQAQLNDPEYVAELVELQEKRKSDDEPSSGYPWAEATREVLVLSDVVRDVRRLQSMVVGLGGGDHKPMPYDVPRSAIQRVKDEHRMSKHRTLVARVVRPPEE